MGLRDSKLMKLYKSVTKNGVVIIFVGIVLIVAVLTGGKRISDK